MPDVTDLYRGLAIIGLVALLPWIAGWWPGGSVLGFPFAAFVILLAGPVLLIVLAGGVAPDSDADPDRSDA